MSKQFDLIVFDWDGTLMDSTATIVYAIQGAGRDLGLATLTDDTARHVIGLGLNEAIAHLWPSLPEADYAHLIDRYRYYYLGRDEMIPLFAGAQAVIHDLHAAGFLLGVATGKSRRGLDRVLDHTGLRAYFHATRCADECFSKPHPEMLQAIMDELGMASERTLMIGDTSHDLLMAKNAGVAALAVSYGAHSRVDLLAHAPLDCVGNIQEMETWLLANA